MRPNVVFLSVLGVSVLLGVGRARSAPGGPGRVRRRLTRCAAPSPATGPRATLPSAQPVPSATPVAPVRGQVRWSWPRWSWAQASWLRWSWPRWWWACWLWVRGSWVRGSADLEHALVLEVVARSLRSGASLTGALGEAVAELPSGDAVADLERSLATIRAGAPVADALEQWTRASPLRARVLAGTALTLGAEVGGMPSRSLDAAASGLRDRAALAREVRALSSQARSSATVMVLGPPLFLAAASTADHRLLHVLFGSPLGLGCFLAGVALDLAGAWWMAALLRAST